MSQIRPTVNSVFGRKSRKVNNEVHVDFRQVKVHEFTAKFVINCRISTNETYRMQFYSTKILLKET